MKKILVFCSILFLISCEEDDYSYSGKYVSENFYFSDVRLFTSGGEITDANTIKQTVLNYFPNEFIMNSDTIFEAEGIIDIEFLSGEKAFVNYRDINEERDVKEKNGVLYIESDDLSRYYDSDDETIWKKISKYKPLYSNTQTLPSSSGFVSYTDYKHCLYLLGFEKKIKVPFLSYVLVHHSSGDNLQVEAGVKNNNSFNKNVLDYLVAGDTLIVQEYYISMIKQ